MFYENITKLMLGERYRLIRNWFSTVATWNITLFFQMNIRLYTYNILFMLLLFKFLDPDADVLFEQEILRFNHY